MWSAFEAWDSAVGEWLTVHHPHSGYLAEWTGMVAKGLYTGPEETEVGCLSETVRRRIEWLGWLQRASWERCDTVVLGGDAARTGYLFESQVAAIYRVLGTRVEQDVVLAGNQIDRGTSGKTPVFGMAQRKTDTTTGKIVAKVVPDAAAKTLISHIQKRVLLQSTVYMDEWKAYNHLGEKGFQHSRVNHSQTVYVSGDAHTQTIEGVWSLLKRGIDGAYHSVSDKYLQSYLDEYAFRYSNRGAGGVASSLRCLLGSRRLRLRSLLFPSPLNRLKE